jgi:hypothetical protein
MMPRTQFRLVPNLLIPEFYLHPTTYVQGVILIKNTENFTYVLEHPECTLLLNLKSEFQAQLKCS